MDKTEDLLKSIKCLIDEAYKDDCSAILNWPKIQGKLDFYVKVLALKKSPTIQKAATSIGMKRTALHEYMRRKMVLTRQEALDLDLESWLK